MFRQLLGCGVAICQEEKQALAGILFYRVAVITSLEIFSRNNQNSRQVSVKDIVLFMVANFFHLSTQ